jgi:acetyltransferase-like isoleucine patch superfamily enzyme
MISFLYRIKIKYHYLITQIFYKPFLQSGGKKAIIINPILITPQWLNLGYKTFIRNNARIEGVSCYENVTFNPTIILGNYVSIEQNLHLTCAEKIVIGNNTAIANNVTITDIDHPYTDIHLPVEKQPIIAKPVYIGSDCKIYSNATILQGVKLGKHTVVAANSVVKAGTYPDYCVLAGVPAKVIKQFDIDTNSWKTIK